MGEKAIITAKTPESTGKPPVSKTQKKVFPEKKSSPTDQVLQLQQTKGNQAVQRLLKSGTLQAKLKIGKPNDKYEQEADRAADKVISMPEKKGSLVNGHWSLGKKEKESSLVNGHQSLGKKEKESSLVIGHQSLGKSKEGGSLVQKESTCPECPETGGIQTKSLAEQITPLVQRQVDEEDETAQTKRIQRQEDEEETQTKLQRLEEEEEPEISAKAAGPQPGTASASVESGIQSLKGGGQPLSDSTRSFYETRFGSDFSQVRVHTSSTAAETAKSINAKAFTKGKDVVFGSGQYSPGTSSGKRLLAHELTHVVQQSKKGK